MHKEVVKEFFDKLAFTWDEGMIKNEEVIKIILDNALVSSGKDILDVACGTGVLIEDYLKRDVNKITAVDLSSEMIRVAKSKYKIDKVKFICGDILDFNDNEKYDCIVVYNAFPHFIDGEELIKHLSILLKDGGTLSIAHGMSRDKINKHHEGSANAVSNELMDAKDLASIMNKYLVVKDVISNDSMYQVVGYKKI
jgi:2-polyprenyl-3-methyl-5-hydroxy-6-metoxy-1,4-benzoquinol methylase